MQKKLDLFALIANILIVGLSIFCLIFFLMVADAAESHRFRYYTNLSNLLAGVAAICYIVCFIANKVKGKEDIPLWVTIFKFVTMVATTLTAFVVLVALAPATSFYEMYRDIRLVTHAVNPVLILVSFLFFENRKKFRWVLSICGIATFVIYGVTYTILVIGLGVWPDFYEFNRWGTWPLIFVAVQSIGFGISQGMYFLRELVRKKVLKLDK